MSVLATGSRSLLVKFWDDNTNLVRAFNYRPVTSLLKFASTELDISPGPVLSRYYSSTGPVLVKNVQNNDKFNHIFCHISLYCFILQYDIYTRIAHNMWGASSLLFHWSRHFVNFSKFWIIGILMVLLLFIKNFT